MEASTCSSDAKVELDHMETDDDRLLLALQIEAVRQEQRMTVAAEEDSDKKFTEINPGQTASSKQAKRDALWRIR